MEVYTVELYKTDSEIVYNSLKKILTTDERVLTLLSTDQLYGELYPVNTNTIPSRYCSIDLTLKAFRIEKFIFDDDNHTVYGKITCPECYSTGNQIVERALKEGVAHFKLRALQDIQARKITRFVTFDFNSIPEPSHRIK